MLIFKSTLIAAFFLLLFSGFNSSSAETFTEENLPEDYTEYEQELQYLEKIQEKDEEEVASMVTDKVSTTAAAPKKSENSENAEMPSDELASKSEVVTPTEPVSFRRIRSR
jgi:hypothetical protein